MSLAVGNHISHVKFGPGEVTGHRERVHQGVRRSFACVEFPHKGLTVQMPLDDDDLAAKIRPIVNPKTARKILRRPQDPLVLERLFEAREGQLRDTVQDGTPQEWATMYWAYVAYVEAGQVMAVSDREIVTDMIGRLSCEVAYSLEQEQDALSATLWGRIDTATRSRRKS